MEAAQRDFLAMVSHDLRSPLTVIRASAQLLQRRGEYREADGRDRSWRTPTAWRDSSTTLPTSSGWKRDIFPCRGSRSTWSPWPANARRPPQEQSARHAVRVEAPDASVCGAWDRVRLGQVVENLLGNALKHGAEDGEVVVRVEERAGRGADLGPGFRSRDRPRPPAASFRSLLPGEHPDPPVSASACTSAASWWRPTGADLGGVAARPGQHLHRGTAAAPLKRRTILASSQAGKVVILAPAKVSF